MSKKTALPARRPSATAKIDQFYITASFDPRSGRVCEVFITGRGKTGSPLNDTLYEMGLWISETIQAHDDLEMKEC